MAELAIVASEGVSGLGVYDTGLFTLPASGVRGAEMIAEVTVHGGVGEKPSLVGQIINDIRGGLAPGAAKSDLLS